MAKRRKRRRAPRPSPPVRDAVPPPRAPSIKARPDEAPPAPWAPFPLTELVILLGIVLAAVGWAAADGQRQATMILGGVGLVSLASAELAWREHFAGYKSHSMLLAGIPTLVTAGLSWLVWKEYALYPRQFVPVAPLVVFAIALWQFREAFKRRSGGIGFRA